MQEMKKRKMFSIFTKLLLSLLLVTVPVYGLSLMLNQSGERSIREGVVNSMRSQVDFYITSLEKELMRIRKMMVDYANDENLTKLSVAPVLLSDYERSRLIKDVQRQLLLFKESSIYVKKVSAYIPSLSISVSTDQLFESIEETEFQAMYSSSADEINPLVYWQNRLFMVRTVPSPPLPNRDSPMVLLQVELSIEELEQFLGQFVSYYEDGFAMLQGKDWSIPQHVQLYPETVRSAIGETTLTMQNGKTYFLASQFSEFLQTGLYVFVPEKHVLGFVEPYRFWLWLLSGATVAVSIFFSYYTYRNVHRPMRKLVRAFHRVEDGDLNVTIYCRSSDEFHYLYDHFNRMVHRLRKLISEVYEQKIRVQRAELKQLQAQIHPHFLYNSFYILYRMARVNEQENVIRFTKYLGDYFRFVARGDGELLPLENEVKHARTYVEIQNFRYENRIRFVFDELPARYCRLYVPRLILQPIIENAYQHGLDHVPSEGMLEVRMRDEADRLIIVVKDNGPGMEPMRFRELHEKLAAPIFSDAEEPDVSGMVNVHRRLRHHFGEESGLSVVNAADGFQAMITIPYREQEGREHHASDPDR